MTPEQQRIKLAEWDGWRPGGAGKSWGEGQTFGIPPNGEDWHWQNTPDYPSDLNAVRELEKKLTDAQWYAWLYVVEKMSGLRGAVPLAEWVAKMTAAQRCEAILKALGLWEEAK